MSTVDKVAGILGATAILAVFLLRIRRTEDYEETVRWDHVVAAFFVVLTGFTFGARLKLLYSIVPSLLLGWAIGLRWACMRIKRVKPEQEYSLSVQVGSWLRLPIGMKMTIPPLSLMLDILIVTGCIVLGTLLGVGVRALVDIS